MRIEGVPGIALCAFLVELGARQAAARERAARAEHGAAARASDAIARLAGDMAHDFNNLLNVILGYGDLLADRLAHDPQLQRFAADIVRAGQQARALTGQLRALSLPPPGEEQP